MEKLKEQLIEWLSEYARFLKVENFVHIVKNTDEHFIVHIFTRENRYQINVHYRADKKICKTYLGGGRSTRKPRAGEDWTRGNDLSDGPFSKEVFEKIMQGILGMELVKVVKPVEFLNCIGEAGKTCKTENDDRVEIKIGNRVFVADKGQLKE